MDLKGAPKTGAMCGAFLRLRGPLRRVSIGSRHKSTRRTYQLAVDGHTTWQQTVMLHVELDSHVTDLFFLCLYRTKSRNHHFLVQSDVSETDDHSKHADDDTHDVGEDAQEVCGGSEYAGSGSRDEGHSSGDLGDRQGSTGDRPGSTGVDWLNEAFVSWNTNNDTAIPDIGWDDTDSDDTVSIYAVGLLLGPVPGKIGQSQRVGSFGVRRTRASWLCSAPKPDAYPSSGCTSMLKRQDSLSYTRTADSTHFHIPYCSSAFYP